MEENELKSVLRKILKPENAPGLVRLAFHDAGTFHEDKNNGGVGGSITLDEELNREENDGLQKSADLVKDLRKSLPKVSLSDMIAISGAVAIELCGGPNIDVGMGRADILEAAPKNRLPDKNDELEVLLKIFHTMGFNIQEFVALSGAHTIGDAEDKPFTEDRLTFNNSYFQRLLGEKRENHLKFFVSDESLLQNDETLKWVKAYAEDKILFFKDFSEAYIKMTWLGARKVH